jgi:3-hydroxy-9,10-secoandrosta-1,3,5(10)-triene-9,17-dione monooxygenase
MATTATVEAPSRLELVQRARGLAPLLRRHALWSEENRRLHDEVVAALSDAGLTRMRVPARYGGYECGTRTVVEVIAELGRADGSAAWNTAIWQISGWIAGLFPDHVQDGFHAEPGVRVCGILSPSAVAVPVEGGVRVSGTWSFNSAALHSHWDMNAAILQHPDGTPEPVMTAIPIAELEIEDTWHTAGLRGSGSVSVTARDLFVPADRVLRMQQVLREVYASELNAAIPAFRGPLLPTACATISGVTLGLAWAARDAFLAGLPGRGGITYTDHSSRAQAQSTHLQVGEASLRVDAAEFHAFRAADLVDAKNADGSPWTAEERARVRGDMGQVGRLAREAVDILSAAAGGRSVYLSEPFQRIERDLRVVNQHAIMHPDTNTELYGRVLCGLEPNTHYL